MVRILGALLRAVVVVIIITTPSFLLPNITSVTREMSLIVGAIVAAFTFFEYGGTNPGFVDFRFAPPFNRFRIAILAAQVVAISLTCRVAVTGSTGLDSVIGQAVSWSSFPYSPVAFALSKIDPQSTVGMQELLRNVFSVSFVVATALAVGFSFLLWIFRWPAGRATFNIWANLPTFAPADIDKTEQRLKRDGFINVVLAVSLLYLIPFTFPYFTQAIGVGLLNDQHTLVWFSALWAFLPALLFVRGTSIYKIGTILGRAVKSR